MPVHFPCTRLKIQKMFNNNLDKGINHNEKSLLIFANTRSKSAIKFPAIIYLFKVNNRNTRKRCKICSKLTIKKPERLPGQAFIQAVLISVFEKRLSFRML